MLFFSLYSNIRVLQRGPGNYFPVDPVKMLDFFVGEIVGTLRNGLVSQEGSLDDTGILQLERAGKGTCTSDIWVRTQKKPGGYF